VAHKKVAHSECQWQCFISNNRTANGLLHLESDFVVINPYPANV